MNGGVFMANLLQQVQIVIFNGYEKAIYYFSLQRGAVSEWNHI